MHSDGVALRKVKKVGEKHLISVIVPVYNEKAEVFRPCIDSILNQTYRDIELILVDDGSDNGETLKIIEEAEKDSRVKVLHRKRTSKYRTISEAFNLGSEHVEGDWVAHNAADNYFEVDWAERLMKFIEGREDEVNGVCTNWINHRYDGKDEVVDMKVNWDWKESSFKNYIRAESLGGWIYKWEWVKDIKWDTRFPRKQTREYNIRVLRRGDIEHYPKFLWHFVQHEPNQQKNYASIRWRILADLKNDILDIGNLMFGIELSRRTGDLTLYYAALSAYREFATDPKWREEYERSEFRRQFERIEGICWEEAIG